MIRILNENSYLYSDTFQICMLGDVALGH